MPQPSVRNPFTEREVSHLQEYLALYYPNDPTRMGESIYERLVRNEDNKWRWAKNHTAHSWRHKYKANKAEYDIKISKLIRSRREKERIAQRAFVGDDRTQGKSFKTEIGDVKRSALIPKHKPLLKKPVSSTASNSRNPPMGEGEPSTSTPMKVASIRPQNPLATPEPSVFEEEVFTSKPTEKSRKRKAQDDEAGHHTSTTTKSSEELEAQASSIWKKAKVHNNDTNQRGHARSLANEVDLGDEMETRNSRLRDNDSHPNISDERLRELFYERFGAPAVQGRIASTVSNIDEKRTEAITTRTVPDLGVESSKTAAIPDDSIRLYPEITEEDCNLITKNSVESESDDPVVGKFEALDGDGDDFVVGDDDVDAGTSSPAVQRSSSDEPPPPTSQPEEASSDSETTRNPPVGARSSLHDSKKAFEDEIFGTPPPDMRVPAVDDVDSGRPSPQQFGAPIASTKASGRALPKFQDRAFREGALASSRGRHLPIRRPDASDSETEAMSDASEIGKPTPRPPKRTSAASITVWPPQRKASAGIKCFPPSSSLASKTDVSFRPSQVASSSTPKTKSGDVSSKTVPPNAGSTSNPFEHSTGNDGKVQTKTFLIPHRTRAVPEEMEAGPSLPIDFPAIANDGSQVDRQVTPTPSIDSKPNHDPFLTSAHAKRIRKEWKGKEKELPVPNTVAIPRSERRQTFAGLKTSPLPDVNLRKHALRGSAGIRSTSATIRRFTSLSNSRVNSPVLDAKVSTFTALFSSINVDLTVDILPDMDVSPSDAELFVRAGKQYIIGAMAKNHGFGEEVVKRVYREYGDLEATDRALVEMKTGAENIFIKGIERRQSMSHVSAELSTSPRSELRDKNDSLRQRSETARPSSKELDLADISRRSSTSKRPRNSLNFTLAAEDPNFDRLLDSYAPPSASRAARAIRHKRVSDIGNGSQLKTGKHTGSRTASGDHRVDDSAIDLDITISDEERDVSMPEDADSVREEAEVFASLTPAPRRVDNSLVRSSSSASPMPTRTVKQSRGDFYKQPNMGSPVKGLPIPVSSSSKPKFKKWTAEEERVLRSNGIGPEYDAIVERRGRTAVKLRQTELNEEDMCVSDS